MNWVKIFFTGGLGLVFALAVMFLVEKYGGIASEVADSIPTVIVPIAYVLLTQEDKSRIECADSVFISSIGVFATNICFLPLWKLIPSFCQKKKVLGFFTLPFTVIGSLLAWFVSAFILGGLEVLLSKILFPVWLYSILVMAACVYIGASLCTRIPPPTEKHQEKCCMKIARSITITLCVIGSCVVSSLGPLIFDFFSGFPAIFSSSIVSVSFAQVALLPTGDIGPMILGGCSTGWFTLLCGIFYRFLNFHVIVAIVVSHLITLFLWSNPVYKYIQYRRKITEECIKNNTPPKKSFCRRPKKEETKDIEMSVVKKEEKKDEVKQEGEKKEEKKDEPKKEEEKKGVLNWFAKKEKKEEVKKEEPKKEEKKDDAKKPSWNPFAKKET
ncbi:hypothetical protein WA588_005255 [Blastocystis sp. NMH]